MLQNDLSSIYYRSVVYFSVDLFLTSEICVCLHIRAMASANTEFACAIVMTIDIFYWLLSVLRSSYLQFQIYLTALFMPLLFALAHVQQRFLDNDFYGYY